MAFYRQVGQVPPKRHTQFRKPDGGLYYEELMGEEGFSSDSSLLYHAGVPSAIVDSQVWDLPDLATVANHPLTPRHLKLHDLFTDTSKSNAVDDRRLVLGNGDVRISYVVAEQPSPYYRNAIGDECVYVEKGSATVETVFGVLNAVEGDYVIIPRATTHRWLPGPNGVHAYCIEANSHIAPPKRYLSRYGQFLEHSPYCERDLHAASEPLVVEDTDVEVLVKHRGSGPGGIVGSRMTYATHPFDVVGWDGCLYPYTFNVSDYEPITGRIHQPPPVHQVFEGIQLRGLQLRAAEGGLPPAVGAGAVLPLERRLRRGHVLLRRRLRGAEGIGDRPRLDLAAPGWVRARAAAVRDRGLAGRRAVRGARGDGRHVPPAGARRGRSGGRRRRLRLDLGRPPHLDPRPGDRVGFLTGE